MKLTENLGKQNRLDYRRCLVDKQSAQQIDRLTYEKQAVNQSSLF